jgi:hypothetical protein
MPGVACHESSFVHARRCRDQGVCYLDAVAVPVLPAITAAKPGHLYVNVMDQQTATQRLYLALLG